MLTTSLAACGVEAPGAIASLGGEADAGIVPGDTDGSDTKGSGDDGEVEVVSIEIEPANAVIEIVQGVLPPALPFAAHGVTAEGERVPLSGTWGFDRPDLATFDGAGLAATGLAGGTGTVRFAASAGEAETLASIRLVLVDDPEGVGPGVAQAFDDAVLPDPALELAYPYDRTVFPRGLAAPQLMWNGGGAGDVYRVRLVANTFDFTGYATSPPPSRYTMPSVPQDVWRTLTDSVVGDVTLELQRHDGTQAYLPRAQTWTLSTANLRGSIYYWAVNLGDVVRIRPGESAPSTFLEKQPGQCVACHSVSRDGSTIVASRDGGASPWSVFDATTGLSLMGSSQSSGFQAISPEGDYVLWRQWQDETFTPTSMLLSWAGDDVPLATLEAPGGTPVHPAWAPDGHTVAFGVRSDGNGLDFTHSSLWLADVDVDTPQFSNLRQVVSEDATRPTITYPTFSPDSQWIAFGRATASRTRGADGELWLVDTAGETALLLAAANGGDAVPASQRHASYEPTFSPVAAGGYFWLVFVSERAYGNLLVDEDPTTRRKQLWVTAIDASPTAGGDPSHPAFWLPGQSPDDHNMRGSWALSPCKAVGASCEAGYECCEGFCIYDEASGGNVCGEPQSCAQQDDACESAADCCDDDAVCIGGFCSQPFIP
ncbi:MAG: PD40 domain-containing protein [Deltaproteobacteria bacterium]|nr:PD40 domain-containing protein [Deltaproteobacteria bacterium]